MIIFHEKCVLLRIIFPEKKSNEASENTGDFYCVVIIDHIYPIRIEEEKEQHLLYTQEALSNWIHCTDGRFTIPLLFFISGNKYTFLQCLLARKRARFSNHSRAISSKLQRKRLFFALISSESIVAYIYEFPGTSIAPAAIRQRD